MRRTTTAAHVEVLSAFARIAQAVGHPARLRILSLLAQAPKTVSPLAEACGESVANTSAHLAVLTDAGVLRRERDGRHIRYSLAHEQVSSLVSALRLVGEPVAPATARRHFAAFEGADVAALTPHDLSERRRAGMVLVDVRPEDEFAAGHLPGARSIPLPRIREAGVPRAASTPLLVYCRGRYCLGAVEAVSLLSRTHQDVRRLQFGVPEWKAAGYALEVQ